MSARNTLANKAVRRSKREAARKATATLGIGTNRSQERKRKRERSPSGGKHPAGKTSSNLSRWLSQIGTAMYEASPVPERETEVLTRAERRAIDQQFSAGHRGEL